MNTKLWSSILQVALLASLLVSCKKTDTPPVTTSLSLVGSWKITAITFTPAWTPFTGATPVPDYIPYLKVNKGETCLTDITLTFTAAGTYSNTFGSTGSCSYASESKIILDYLFNSGSTYTETDNQATVYGKDKQTSLTLTKSGTNQLLTLQFQSNEDLSSNKINTTYAVTLAKQ